MKGCFSKIFCGVFLHLCVVSSAFGAAVGAAQLAPKTGTAQVKPKVALTDVQLDAQISTKLRALVSKVAVAPVQPAVLVEVERQIKLDPALLEPTLAGLSIMSEAFLDGALDRGDNLSGLDEKHDKVNKEDPFAQGSSYPSSVGSLMQDLRERSNRFRGRQTSGGSAAQQMLGDKMNKLWGALDAVRGLGGGTSVGAGGQSSGRISDPRGMAASGNSKKGDTKTSKTGVTYTAKVVQETTSTNKFGQETKTKQVTWKGNNDEWVQEKHTTSDDGSKSSTCTSDSGDGCKTVCPSCTKAKAGGGHCPQDNCEGDHPDDAAQVVAVMQALGCAIGGVCPESSSDRISRMLGMSGRCDGRNGNSCNQMGVQHSVSPEELAERLGISDRSACDGRRDDVCGGADDGGHAVAPLCMSSDICGGGGIIEAGLNARDLRSALQDGMSADLNAGGLGITLEFVGVQPITAHVVGNIRIVFDVPPGIAD